MLSIVGGETEGPVGGETKVDGTDIIGIGVPVGDEPEVVGSEAEVLVGEAEAVKGSTLSEMILENSHRKVSSLTPA
jgi:hypothetical protein